MQNKVTLQIGGPVHNPTQMELRLKAHKPTPGRLLGNSKRNNTKNGDE